MLVLRRRWLFISLALAILGPAEPAWAANGATAKEVLVLHSTRRDALMSVAGDRELPRVIEQGLRHDLQYYSEYIDLGRFPDPAYRAAFRDFLRVKYKGQRFDVVIAIQGAAVEFVSAYRSTLFPDVPVVFLALSPPVHAMVNSTGVVAQPGMARTLTLASALQPEVRNVFVVSGAGGTDKEYERLTRMQLKLVDPRLNVTYLSGLRTQELEAQLATLPERSIVYYVMVYQDGAGDLFNPVQYLERVAAAARVPTYSWIDSSMDHGVVGGSLLDREAMMQAVAKQALRVLQGERADRIPLTTSDFSVGQVDWRSLRRWGISEARVPAGVLVRFRELSAWDHYKGYILGILAVVLAQAALISGLLVQRTKRRRAEEQLRGKQATLRTNYERIRDLGARLLNAQETERSRIARELHDDIGQQTALLEIDLKLLDRALHGEAEQLAGNAVRRVRDIAKSVHDLSHRLHPAKLRVIGLVPALEGLLRELSQSGIDIVFTHDPVPSKLPMDVTLCLFRVVQEALQNVLKYSRARQVSVRLTRVPEGLTVTIVDDGIGFDIDEAWGKGLGLIGMNERVEAIGGAFEVRSGAGAGTRLYVAVPLGVGHEGKTVAI